MKPQSQHGQKESKVQRELQRCKTISSRSTQDRRTDSGWGKLIQEGDSASCEAGSRAARKLRDAGEAEGGRRIGNVSGREMTNQIDRQRMVEGMLWLLGWTTTTSSGAPLEQKKNNGRGSKFGFCHFVSAGVRVLNTFCPVLDRIPTSTSSVNGPNGNFHASEYLSLHQDPD